MAKLNRPAQTFWTRTHFTREEILAKKHRLYKDDIYEQRRKSRDRARQRKGTLGLEEMSINKDAHREAQARYRMANREKLRMQAIRYRLRKKREAEIAADEAEYQRLSALE